MRWTRINEVIPILPQDIFARSRPDNFLHRADLALRGCFFRARICAASFFNSFRESGKEIVTVVMAHLPGNYDICSY
jgi:hypothetical protein